MWVWLWLCSLTLQFSRWGHSYFTLATVFGYHCLRKGDLASPPPVQFWTEKEPAANVPDNYYRHHRPKGTIDVQNQPSQEMNWVLSIRTTCDVMVFLLIRIAKEDEYNRYETYNHRTGIGSECYLRVQSASFWLVSIRSNHRWTIGTTCDVMVFYSNHRWTQSVLHHRRTTIGY